MSKLAIRDQCQDVPIAIILKHAPNPIAIWGASLESFVHHSQIVFAHLAQSNLVVRLLTRPGPLRTVGRAFLYLSIYLSRNLPTGWPSRPSLFFRVPRAISLSFLWLSLSVCHELTTQPGFPRFRPRVSLLHHLPRNGSGEPARTGTGLEPSLGYDRSRIPAMASSQASPG